MRKSFLFIAGVLLLALPFYAQEDQIVKRIEKQMQFSTSDHMVVPLAESKEVIVLRETNSFRKGPEGQMRTWMLTKYDEDLNAVWFHEVLTLRNREVSNYIVDKENNKVYFLINFSTINNKFQLLFVDIETGETEMHFPKGSNFSISEFKQSGDLLYLSGRQKGSNTRRSLAAYAQITIHIGNPVRALKSNPCSMAFDLNSGTTYESAPKMKSYSMHLDSKIDEAGNLTQLYKNVISKKDMHLFKRKIAKGDTIEQEKININPSVAIINSAELFSHKNKEFMVGSYRKYGKKENWITATSSVNNEGIYFSDVTDPENPKIKFHKFSEMQSFRTTLENLINTQESFQKEFSKDEDERYNLKNFFVYEPVIRDDEIHVTLEHYVQTYRLVNTTSGSQSAFNGNLHWGFTMLAFDQEGNLLYDLTFPLGNLKTFDERKTVDVTYGEDYNSTYTYSNGYEIVKRYGKADEVSKPTRPIPYEEETTKEGTKTFRNSTKHWFGDYYIAFGNEQVKLGVLNYKNLFFLTKMKFQE